ncbi:MAG: SDR family NAD(P)-dependent oxidoreductase [Alkalispirochaetaceae bacterium]
MSADFTGRLALLTGASRGIGEAIASMLYRRGATVYLLGRPRETLEGAAGRVEASGKKHEPRLRPDLDESALTRPASIAGTVEALLSLDSSAMIDQVQIRRASKEPWS